MAARHGGLVGRGAPRGLWVVKRPPQLQQQQQQAVQSSRSAIAHGAAPRTSGAPPRSTQGSARTLSVRTHTGTWTRPKRRRSRPGCTTGPRWSRPTWRTARTTAVGWRQGGSSRSSGPSKLGRCCVGVCTVAFRVGVACAWLMWRVRWFVVSRALQVMCARGVVSEVWVGSKKYSGALGG